MNFEMTGLPVQVIAIAIAIAAPIAAVGLFRRAAARRRWLQDVGRWAMVLFSQFAAVVAVFIVLNNYFGLYSSWGDLLGQTLLVPPAGAGTSTTPTLVDSAKGKSPVTFQELQKNSIYFAQVPIAGTSALMRLYVVVPPQYNDPAFATKTFPVVELLHGYPGSPNAWIRAMHVVDNLAKSVKQGGTPFVLVIPQISVPGAPDLECTNLPGQPQIETFLTTRVRTLVTENFRVEKLREGWGLMGNSEGGYCAAMLTLRYPQLFAAGVEMSGYPVPTSPYFAAVPALKKSGSIAVLLKHRPAVSILATNSVQDTQSTDSLTPYAKAQRPTMAYTQTFATGGHNFNDWAAQVPGNFLWLSQHLLTVR